MSKAHAVEPSGRRVPVLTVADIMTAPVVTVTPDATVGEAQGLQRRSRIRHLPVIRDNLLVGIVSDRNLGSARHESVAVADVMTRPVFVLSPDTSVRDAARIFRQRRLGAMPVLSGRELVGIVSMVDVVRALEERLTVDADAGSC